VSLVQVAILPLSPTVLQNVFVMHVMPRKVLPTPESAVHCEPSNEMIAPNNPPALHREIELHETALSWFVSAGILSWLQVDPLHERTIPLVTVTSCPTTLHKLVVGQDTPLSVTLTPLVSVLQVEPFHETITPPFPTALHKLVEPQLTPLRLALVLLVSALHAEPFHEIMAPPLPTALHKVVEGHAMLLR
jgi:hypothetical protein